MPNRILKDSICTSPNIDALSIDAEVFFYRLMVQCDDFGRMDARLPVLRSRCYPLRLDSFTDAIIGNLLNELVHNGLVTVYEVAGRPYLEMVTWHKHQQVRAKRSKYPQPIAFDINCDQLQSNAPVIQSNPIQSESKSESNDTPTKSEVKLSAHQEIFGALTEVCVLDGKLKATQIGRTAKQLADAGYTAQQVVHFGQWWRVNDWRGKKGNPPTLPQVVELIKQSTVHQMNGNGRNGNGNGRQTEDWDAYAKSLPLDNLGKYDEEPVTF